MSDQHEDFAAFFSDLFGAVRSYSARRIGWVDAEEITSEVFLLAWKAWPTPTDHPLPWLYRTAANVIYNRWRAEEVRARTLAHLAHGLDADSTTTDVADDVSDRHLAAAALAALGPVDRDLVLLAAWEGLSAGDLARVLQCRTATAYVRLHRARSRLQDHLARLRVDPDPPPTPRPSSAVPASRGRNTRHGQTPQVPPPASGTSSAAEVQPRPSRGLLP